VNVFNVAGHVPEFFAAVGAAGVSAGPGGSADGQVRLPELACRALPLLPGPLGFQFQLVQVFVVEVDRV
jgi:hypothetical protein